MSFLDVANKMEYDERLALFRQTRLNPFDRGEEEDGPQGDKTPPQHGEVYHKSWYNCLRIAFTPVVKFKKIIYIVVFVVFQLPASS